jgi:hypothetical protein
LVIITQLFGDQKILIQYIYTQTRLTYIDQSSKKTQIVARTKQSSARKKFPGRTYTTDFTIN